MGETYVISEFRQSGIFFRAGVDGVAGVLPDGSAKPPLGFPERSSRNRSIFARTRFPQIEPRDTQFASAACRPDKA